jgi:D-3-phosphoglycerate dehydrogenase / 2-oxoglutarate reductase
MLYSGSVDEAERPLVSAALIGLLSPVVGRSSINAVNANHIAESRGIKVERSRGRGSADFAEYIEIRLSGSKAETRVAGTLLAEGHPRIVRIDGFHIDLNPHGTFVVIRNRDVPGVIGRVGTIIGDAGINIGEYHQARMQAGGQALAAISVDGKLPNAVLTTLRELPEVLQVKQVELE